MRDADLYLAAVVAMHRVEQGPESTPERIRRRLAPAFERWGGRNFEGVQVSGSYAKGTAIRGLTLAPSDVDVDLFLSLSPEAPGSIEKWQDTLMAELRGYQAKMGNVSVKALVGNTRVDLTPGRRTPESGGHTLYQRRAARRLRTNVKEQIQFVRESGRREDMLAAKVWRRRQGVYFPSFCLELAVIEALRGVSGRARISERLMRVLEWLAEELPEAVLRDPGNASNEVTELMTEEEKWRVAHAARASLGAERWEEVAGAACH